MNDINSDAMCSGMPSSFINFDSSMNFLKGPEHGGTGSNAPQPSFCTLPLFHEDHVAPVNDTTLGSVSQGFRLTVKFSPKYTSRYTSQDGHYFSCKNPIVMQQAFHVYVLCSLIFFWLD